MRAVSLLALREIYGLCTNDQICLVVAWSCCRDPLTCAHDSGSAETLKRSMFALFGCLQLLSGEDRRISNFGLPNPSMAQPMVHAFRPGASYSAEHWVVLVCRVEEIVCSCLA